MDIRKVDHYFFKKRWKSVHWLHGDSKLLIASELLDDFASVLDQVAELNAVLGSVSYAEVVWYLKNAFNAKKVRNLQGPTNIYVVNAEEAVTIDPTHLWITECTVKKPSLQVEIVTMLPFAEQRMVGIPGSHPSVDFTYRRILFESLCCSTNFEAKEIKEISKKSQKELKDKTSKDILKLLLEKSNSKLYPSRILNLGIYILISNSQDFKEKNESDKNKMTSDIFEKLSLSANKAEKDIGIYKSSISKMEQAKELIEELRIKDKKKTKKN